MKILLVNSYPGRKQLLVFPLGLACVAAGVKQHEVKAMDPILFPDPLDAVRAQARAFNPDVIGISFRNIDPARSYDPYEYFPGFVNTLAAAREGAPDACMVVGGSGFSLFPEVIMRKVDGINVGVYLDGEVSFPELLDNFGSPESVPGLYVRRSGGEVVFTGERESVDLDAVALPDREFLDISAYAGVSEQQIGVETHRGCVMKCIYCTYPRLSGSRIRTRSPEYVLEDIENLKRLGVKKFFFTDPCFNNPPQVAQAVCRELEKRKTGLSWSAYFSEKFTTPEFIRLCRDTGCRCFIYGADAGSDTVLERMGKQITRREIEDAYAIVSKEAPGIPLKTAFMINSPGETFRSFFAMMSIVIKGVLMRQYEPSFSCIRIYPGTEMHRIAIEEGVVDREDDLFKPVFYNPPGLRFWSWLIDAMSNMALGILRFFKATHY